MALIHIKKCSENAVLMSGAPHGATVSGAAASFKGRGARFLGTCCDRAV